jgi:hypothetical protein
VGIERELRSSEQRRGQLEQRRELLASEHGRAVEVRRALLLNGNTTDVKALSRADDRVVAAEVSLSGTDDALTELRAKLVELAAELAELRAEAQREARAKELEAQIPEIDAAMRDVAAPIEQLIGVFKAAPVPEAAQAALFLADCWKQIQAQAPFVTSILTTMATAARLPPPPKPAETASPQPQPYPEFAKKPYSAPPPERWVDWDSAKYHRQ